MQYNIPIEEKSFKIIESKDSVEKLVEAYNENRNTMNGKTVSDIANIFEELKDWILIEKAEMKIPYLYGTPRKEPTGHRIWYLSQESGHYYYGNFFDLKVSETQKRTVRLQCKLSKAAIELFEQYPGIKKNIKI